MKQQILEAVNQIKTSYLSHTPIVWLVTKDKEVASEIVCNFIVEHKGALFADMENQCYAFSALAVQESLEEDHIYYSWIKEPNVSMDGGDNSQSVVLYKNLESFLNGYYNVIVPGQDPINDNDNIKKSIVIIASPSIPQDSWIKQYVEIIYVNTITDDEIKSIVGAIAKDYMISISAELANKLVVYLRGFNERQIQQVILRCIFSGFFDNNQVNQTGIYREIRLLKKQMLEGYKGLKWIDLDNEETSNVAGLSCISDWLDERKDIFNDIEKSKKEGKDIPKGILVTGIPGSGKSLMAKNTAKKLGLPLISLDMGTIQEGLVGASEQNMEEALRKVENMAPCVLWVDEIEKALAGSSASGGDGGVMKRMFGKFLTWMQEKTAPCFVFATSNDISQLPPELFRSERFDDKFFSFMPMVEECAEILSSLVIKENNKFKENNNDEGCIFSEVITTKDFWIEYLNSISIPVEMKKENDIWKWNDKKVPSKKLFTGADLSTFIKLIKFKLLTQKGPQNSPPPFKEKDVKIIANSVLGFNSDDKGSCILDDNKEDGFMPYGQTNLESIAKCFLQQTTNPFKPASGYKNTIIKFKEFDVFKGVVEYLPSEEIKKNKYDLLLYSTIVGAINHYGTNKKGNNAN